eukprot:SAG31_NODE_40224_length_282_cov_0.846995_1_plen_22_part_10
MRWVLLSYCCYADAIADMCEEN